MFDLTKDIQSLTAFRRRYGEFLNQLKKTKRPVVRIRLSNPILERSPENW